MSVKHAGLEVQTCKGYFGLGMSLDSPVLEYEAPALAVLLGKSQPEAFAIHTAAFNFPEPARPGLVPIVVEVPGGSISFAVDKDKRSYRADFSVVVLISDQAQRVVRKLSAHYTPGGAYTKLDDAINGKNLFYKETELEAGDYTFSAIVYDALARQSATGNGIIIVANPETTKLELSSIVIVKNTDQIPLTEKGASRLFHFGEVLLYPNLNEPVSKSENEKLALFLTVYAPGAVSTPQLTLELIGRGAVAGQFFDNLPAPDATAASSTRAQSLSKRFSRVIMR